LSHSPASVGSALLLVKTSSGWHKFAGVERTPVKKSINCIQSYLLAS
jgi:hypothetical protein